MPKINPDDYVMLPWTIKGPFEIAVGDGVQFQMTVAELPGLTWSAATESEALYGFKKALRAHIAAMIDSGKPLPQRPGEPVTYSVLTPKRPVLAGFFAQPRIAQV